MPSFCLCGFCGIRVSYKSYCATCPNKPPNYVNPARKQILAATAKYDASELGQATKARYSASESGQATQARYRASESGQAYQADYQADYRASESGRAYQAAYQAVYRADITKQLREKAEAWQKEHGNGREALDDKAARAEVSDRALFSPRKACCKT